MKTNNWIKQSDNAHKMVEENQKNCALYRWQKKEVLAEELLWNGTSLDNVSLNGVGRLSFDDGSIRLDENDDVENLDPRPNCSIEISLDTNDYTAYNRVYLKMFIKATGFVNFYVHYAFGNNNAKVVHTASVIPNIWNDIMFEVSDVKRDDVKNMIITPFLFGTPPEALPDVSFYIKDVKIQKVKADYIKGWHLEDRIAYSHVGYFTDAKKTAIIESDTPVKFYVKNELGIVQFENTSERVSSNLGVFQVLNFTNVTKTGMYYLETNDIQTELFEISANPYELSIWKSMQFLRTLRCGVEVENVHSACHLNCRTVNTNGNMVPNFGGWHDAGDVSQFEICTAEMSEAILDLASTINDENLKERLKEEAKIGCDWLLQTSFSDGKRALSVGYRMWRKNELSPTNKGVLQNYAEEGPFENFLACAALLKAYQAYDNMIYREWCLRTAILDFETAKRCYEQNIFTKRWGSNIDSVVAGMGAECASLLYTITKNDDYRDYAVKCGDIIMQTQQLDYPKWDIPLRGFFYEDVNHENMLTYEHRGHEQTPIQGLYYLCTTFKDHPNYAKWYRSVELYGEYIKKVMEYTAPYNLLCAHVYDLNKFNMERFTVPARYGTKEEALENLKCQARHGIKLHDDVYLRIFPVAIQRRGFHATLLSKTKAVSLVALLTNDQDLHQIVIDQLEWIMGKNPFASCTMYGEGYNYHPLYVAYSPQLVGALPVGIETDGYDDEPYWPTVNNAVYKEIWGHTTGKYLFVLNDIIKKNG